MARDDDGLDTELERICNAVTVQYVLHDSNI